MSIKRVCDFCGKEIKPHEDLTDCVLDFNYVKYLDKERMRDIGNIPYVLHVKLSVETLAKNDERVLDPNQDICIRCACDMFMQKTGDAK